MRISQKMPGCFLLAFFLLFTGVYSGNPRQAHSQVRKRLQITAQQTHVRQHPSELYQALGTARKGETFDCYGKTASGWYQVQFGKQMGYVRQKDAKIFSTAAAGTKKAAKQLQKHAAAPAQSAPAVKEVPKAPPRTRPLPWKWIIAGAVMLLIFILYFVHNVRQAREFEERLRHKPRFR